MMNSNPKVNTKQYGDTLTVSRDTVMDNELAKVCRETRDRINNMSDKEINTLIYDVKGKP
jgi:hypothetical protein